MCTPPLSGGASSSDELMNYSDVDLTVRSCGPSCMHGDGSAATLYDADSACDAAMKAVYSDVACRISDAHNTGRDVH